MVQQIRKIYFLENILTSGSIIDHLEPSLVLPVLLPRVGPLAAPAEDGGGDGGHGHEGDEGDGGHAEAVLEQEAVGGGGDAAAAAAVAALGRAGIKKILNINY